MRCFQTGLVKIDGSFDWADTDVTLFSGAGFSVAHTTTGTATITLAESYHDIVSVVLSLGTTTDTDTLLHAGVISVSAGTIEVLARDISGAALADPTDSRIYFQVWVKNSNATP